VGLEMGFYTGATILLGVLTAASAGGGARAGPGVSISTHGVSVWVPSGKFPGDMTFVSESEWTSVSADELPRRFRGDFVIAAPTVVGAFDTETGCLSVYTRRGDHLHKRGVVLPEPTGRATDYELLPGTDKAGPGIAVRSQESRLEYTIHLNKDGVMEFKPARATKLTISKSELRYGIVPSCIGVDLVYDPRKHGEKGQLYIPSMNLFVGLVQGEECVMIGAWPPGEQVARLVLKEVGGGRAIDGFSIELNKQSLYLSYLEHPDLWHAEVLKDTYLEKNTVIGWEKPFPAKWIGRFFIESEQIHYPFFFRSEQKKMWGRCIRGWFHYPVWFNDGKSYVHFEKKFPPQGELLIYFLEHHDDGQAVSSPFDVMQNALGRQQASSLLDLEGIEHRPLLEHRKAVCAMTREMAEIFKSGNEVKEKATVKQLADDIARFIRLIRERVFEFADFAKELRRFLEAAERADPSLAEALAGIKAVIEEMELKVKTGLPGTSLDEVGQWAERMTGLTGAVHKENSGKFETLAAKARDLAGAQDDLTRDLSVLTIRLMEKAAELGVDSLERVKLAEQIIARARKVLRRPSWWEPRRCYLPKSDPGIPERVQPA